jgi:hypothetical protein
MPKIEEILLNFSLITIVGSMFTFGLSQLRDAKVRNEFALSSIRDIIKQIDDLYRSVKQTKRMIRSRLKEDAKGYLVEADFFATRMDELSNTQLKLEQIRYLVRTRVDFFDAERRKRILMEIEYSEKYLHDVVGEFEKRRVCWNEGFCCITPSCEMLADFLSLRPTSEEIEGALRILDDAETSQERFEAFRAIVKEMGRIDNFRRHKPISDKCMLLAMREMRDIVVERQPGMNLRRLIPRRRKWELGVQSAAAISSPRAIGQPMELETEPKNS